MIININISIKTIIIIIMISSFNLNININIATATATDSRYHRQNASWVDGSLSPGHPSSSTALHLSGMFA
jgi:hypothetical protein